MKIVTNLAIPYKVYLFYQALAKGLPNCTKEDIIIDSLERYMAIVSSDIIQKALDETSEKTQQSPSKKQHT